MRRNGSILLIAAGLGIAPLPAPAQELPVGQGRADYDAWLAANPGHVGQVLSFEAWQDAAGVKGVLPTWQMVRTASMWRECGGAAFEVPPFRMWPDMTRTLRFIRDHVRAAVGEVEAVSGYRNPALNRCARGSERSAHLDFYALDLVPKQALSRRQLFERLCPMHARHGGGAGVGLGFYAFTRFHIDTRSFRRWGAAGPAGNESPCAVLERGGDPEAPPLPPPAAPPVAATPAPAPMPPSAPPQAPTAPNPPPALPPPALPAPSATAAQQPPTISPQPQ
jgi:peptidase M15-like protein